MDPKNKLGAMPVRPLLYTMAVPLMLSLLIQSLYNIVDSIFVARLSETALTAASLVYAIQFLMIAIGVGTAVGLNALLSRKLGQKKPEEACRAATTGLFLMPVNGLGQAAIPVVGYNYGSKQSDRVKQAWKVLLPTGIVFALCGTAVFLLFPRQLLGLFSASEEMLAFGVPALRIISVTFLFAVITILCGYFASGLGNGVVNMIGGALRQLVVLVPCLWLLSRFFGVDYAWFAFWVSEILACVYSLWAARKELKNKVEQQ